MELTSTKREKTGKKVKEIRRHAEVPAVVFGNEIESTSISINLLDFQKLFKKAGETSLIDLKLGSNTHKVLINDVQNDPISSKIIHVSFYKPNLKEKTEVEVPVEVIGESTNELLKSGAAILLLLHQEIRVSALPTNLPEKFSIDVTNLANIGDTVTIAQLDFDRSKVEIADLEEDEVVIRIDAPQQEVEEEVPVAEADAIAKMEATAETKDEEEETEEKEKK